MLFSVVFYCLLVPSLSPLFTLVVFSVGFDFLCAPSVVGLSVSIFCAFRRISLQGFRVQFGGFVYRCSDFLIDFKISLTFLVFTPRHEPV